MQGRRCPKNSKSRFHQAKTLFFVDLISTSFFSMVHNQLKNINKRRGGNPCFVAPSYWLTPNKLFRRMSSKIRGHRRVNGKFAWSKNCSELQEFFIQSSEQRTNFPCVSCYQQCVCTSKSRQICFDARI